MVGCALGYLCFWLFVSLVGCALAWLIMRLVCCALRCMYAWLFVHLVHYYAIGWHCDDVRFNRKRRVKKSKRNRSGEWSGVLGCLVVSYAVR